MDAPCGFGDWQSALNTLLTRLEEQDTFTDFAQLETNRERVEFIIQKKLLRRVKWLSSYFDVCKEWHSKSETEAQVWKTKGNKSFQNKQYAEAAHFYTQCCIYAPTTGGDLLAVGYGNRSAALFHLTQYQNCITDIDRALAQGAPQTSKPKLLLRKISALSKLNQNQSARDGIDRLKEYIGSKDFCLIGDKKEAFLKELGQLEKEIKSRCEKLASTEEASNEKEVLSQPVVYGGANKVVTQASRAVTLAYTSEKTRHLKAAERIPHGATVIVEKPFSAILLPDHYDSHCHHCFSPLPLSAISCDRCSLVQFCSDPCRSAANQSYHRTECPYQDLLHSVGIAHLSLRTVLLAGKTFLNDFLHNSSNHRMKTGESSPIKGINSKGVYGHNYLTVYDLMTHEENTAPQDMLQYALTAALLLCTLVHAGHFDDLEINGSKLAFDKECFLSHYLTPKSSPPDVEIPAYVSDIGGVLLRHILQLICNAHAITALKTVRSPSESDGSLNIRVEEQEQVRIATAIYPTASLMNHSCDPTIVSSFIGDLLVVKTVKTVAKEEEIFNCYGPHSRRMLKAERQDILQSQYHFHCQCAACQSHDVCQQRFGAYRCSICSDILSGNLCVGCGYVESPDYLALCERNEQKMDKLFDSALTMMKKDNRGIVGKLEYPTIEYFLNQFKRLRDELGIPSLVESVQICHRNLGHEALKLLLQCQRERTKFLYKDHRNLAFGEDAIARCHANLGDFSSSADHLYNSVEFARLMYGPDTIEYGHELQKLAEVLFNAERFTECLDIARRALNLLRVIYSPCHKILKQINDLKIASEVALTPLMPSR